MRRITLIVLTTLLFTAGCGGSRVARGVSLYEERNYIEAAEAFERTQSRLVSMKPVERVRYGLYRGLTLLALGDLRGGERWLDYADVQQRLEPVVLPVEERAMLARGRTELAQRLQASWHKPDPRWERGVATTTNDGIDSSAQQ